MPITRYATVFCTCALFLHAAEPENQLKANVGAEQSQAAASDRVWKLYLNLAANMDIGHGQRFFVDGNITSTPQETNFAVSTIGKDGPALLRKVKVNEMFQSVNLLTGFEFHENHISGTGRFQLKPIVAAGFTTPLAPKESISQIYIATDDARKRIPEIGDKQYVVFSTQDRDRFYLQWYGGIRIKDTQGVNYPAFFDITFGQNSLVTGPCLCGVVWRFAAYYPIPGAEWFSIFGESYMRLRSGSAQQPLFLAPAAGIAFTDPSVAIVAPTSTRDYYHIGFGLDIFKAFDALNIEWQNPFKKKQPPSK